MPFGMFDLAAIKRTAMLMLHFIIKLTNPALNYTLE